jgi:hypothetical protein
MHAAAGADSGGERRGAGDGADVQHSCDDDSDGCGAAAESAGGGTEPERSHYECKPTAIDNLISTLHGELKVYAAYLYLAWLRPGKSSIDDKMKTPWDANGKQTRYPEVIAELDVKIAEFLATKKAAKTGEGVVGTNL